MFESVDNTLSGLPASVTEAMRLGLPLTSACSSTTTTTTMATHLPFAVNSIAVAAVRLYYNPIDIIKQSIKMAARIGFLSPSSGEKIDPRVLATEMVVIFVLLARATPLAGWLAHSSNRVHVSSGPS